MSWAYAPARLPTWVPRLTLLLAGGVALVLAAGAAWAAWVSRRRHAGGPLWRLLGAPVDSRAFAALATGALWDLLRGGAKLARPGAGDLSQRYAELLAANLGQPTHRDLLLAVHDLDARRDLVFGLVGGEAGARQFPGPVGPALRRAEALDLADRRQGTAGGRRVGGAACPPSPNRTLCGCLLKASGGARCTGLCDRPPP